MAPVHDPNIVVGEIALGGLALVLFWRLFVWIRDSPKTPDPWDAEMEQKIHDPDTVETCPHCSTPLEPDGWFCSHCNRATGPYNNLMPFVCVFSEGEVFRNGVENKLRPSPLIVVGYLLLSINAALLLASVSAAAAICLTVIYWYFLFRNFMRQDKAVEETES